jgi:tetratricopeptide (TPR) repeat protein
VFTTFRAAQVPEVRNETRDLLSLLAPAAGHLKRGWQLLQRGQFQAAIEPLDAALQVDPRCVLAYAARAWAQAFLKKFPQAERDLREVERLAPQTPIVWQCRGALHILKGEYDRAIADYTEAIRLDPNYAEAYYERGVIYNMYQIDLNRAIENFTEAIRLDPKFPLVYNDRAMIYNDRGNAYKGKGQANRALADYNEAIRLNPRQRHAYGNRALVYRQLGRIAEAQADEAVHNALKNQK